MSKFVIEPNKIYDVNFCSYSDLNFRVFIFNEFDLSCLFGPFVFDDSLEADVVEEYEEA